MAASPSLHPSGSTPGAAALDLEVLSDLGAAARRLDQIADRTNSGQAEAAIKTVDAILAQVRSEGDQALLELSERFDGVRPDPLRIPIQQLQAAWDQCEDSLRISNPCEIHLNICAILSQMGKHELALHHAMKALLLI